MHSIIAKLSLALPNHIMQHNMILCIHRNKLVETYDVLSLKNSSNHDRSCAHSITEFTQVQLDMHSNCINSFILKLSPELDLEEHPDRQSGSPKPSRKALNSDSGAGPAFTLHNEKRFVIHGYRCSNKLKSRMASPLINRHRRKTHFLQVNALLKCLN